MVLVGTEQRGLAQPWSRGTVKRHVPKVQTHPSTHLQEHCGPRSTDLPLAYASLAKAGTRFRSLHGAEVGRDAISTPSRRSKDHGAFTSEDDSLVRRVLRTPWGEVGRGHQGGSQQDHQLSGYMFSWLIHMEPEHDLDWTL